MTGRLYMITSNFLTLYTFLVPSWKAKVLHVHVVLGIDLAAGTCMRLSILLRIERQVPFIETATEVTLRVH